MTLKLHPYFNWFIFFKLCSHFILESCLVPLNLCAFFKRLPYFRGQYYNLPTYSPFYHQPTTDLIQKLPILKSFLIHSLTSIQQIDPLIFIALALFLSLQLILRLNTFHF
jgi:hypothetical protein